MGPNNNQQVITMGILAVFCLTRGLLTTKHYGIRHRTAQELTL